jgi:hypothetical protein
VSRTARTEGLREDGEHGGHEIIYCTKIQNISLATRIVKVMATSLPDFPLFDMDAEPTSLGIQWKKWVERLENLFVAVNIKDKV